MLAQEIPPLGNAARQLLALSEKERHDARLLTLLAQKDPVYLARLLTAADTAKADICTVEEAIRVLGARKAYALMRAAADTVSYPAHDRTAPARQHLLTLSVSLTLTARRLGSALHLPARASMELVLAALLDVLGVYALLVFEHPGREALEAYLLELAARRQPLARTAPELAGWGAMSRQLARRWGARTEVIATLHSLSEPTPAPASLPARALALAYELVTAKLAHSALAAGALSASALLGQELAGHADGERALELVFLGF